MKTRPKYIHTFQLIGRAKAEKFRKISKNFEKIPKNSGKTFQGSDAPGYNKLGFGRARPLKFEDQAADGLGLKCTICPPK